MLISFPCFRLALEQLWLMSEIENFYPLSAFMKSGLEKWLIKNSKENLNPEDVLLWAPRDSKVRILALISIILESIVHH